MKGVVINFVVLTFVILFSISANSTGLARDLCGYFFGSQILAGVVLEHQTMLEETASVLPRPPSIDFEPSGMFERIRQEVLEDPEFALYTMEAHGRRLDLENLAMVPDGTYLFAVVHNLPADIHEFRFSRTTAESRSPSDKIPQPHHEQVTGGFPVLTAGEIQISRKAVLTDGRITQAYEFSINNRSGVYLPNKSSLYYAVNWLVENRIPTSRLRIVAHEHERSAVVLDLNAFAE